MGVEEGIERRVLVGLGKGLGLINRHRRGQMRERERRGWWWWCYVGVTVIGQGKVSGIRRWDCLGGVCGDEL